MMTVRTGILTLTLSCFFLGGCDFDHDVTGPLRTDAIHLDGGSAEKANVELDMGAGKLNVSGGASKLLDGTFEYNVDAWKPIVNNTVNGPNATVTIKQPSGTHGGGSKHYVWDLQLNDNVLTDLAVNCGAGQATLNLGDVMLRSLSVAMGAGQVKVDLRGTPKHDYDVKINGGVGQSVVRLPQGVGIYLTASKGIGALNVTGLQKQGDHWENDLYNKAKVTVKVDVNGGIGEINISE
jgi:hypothetical protein